MHSETINASAPYSRRELVKWWEARRLRYNLWVGSVGVVAWFLVLCVGSLAVKPGEDFEEPIMMIYWAVHLWPDGERLFFARLDRRHEALPWPPKSRSLQSRIDLLSDPDGTAGNLGRGCLVHHALYREEAGLKRTEPPYPF